MPKPSDSTASQVPLSATTIRNTAAVRESQRCRLRHQPPADQNNPARFERTRGAYSLQYIHRPVKISTSSEMPTTTLIHSVQSPMAVMRCRRLTVLRCDSGD